MNVLPDPLNFDWDTGNIEKNVTKHGVSNRETEEVFFSKPFLMYEDTKHSGKEKRFCGLGKTDDSRLLFISFTIQKKKVLIISVRDMSKKEEVLYEKI